jgi:hypothetical protein
MARYDLPRLVTYEAASAHERDVKPIRGRSPECKPLGSRKDTQFTIRREADESIVASCYRSDLIRWCPDGRVFVANGGWASVTSHDFISRVLLGCLSACTYDGKTWVTSYYASGDYRSYPLAEGGQWFVRGASGRSGLLGVRSETLIPETPNYPVTHVINPPAMRAARKEIAPFVAYFMAMMKLTEWAPVEPVAGAPIRLLYKDDPEFLAAMTSNDTERWAYALERIRNQSTVTRYVRDNTASPQFRYRTMRYVSQSEAKDYITGTLLRTHRSKLLTKRTHTDGKFVKDAYKDYADD